jgi:DNA-binding transcriptional LysR family regulator
VTEVDSLPAIIGMVQRGSGVTVLPYSTVASQVESGLIRVWSLDFPQISRALVLGRTGDHKASPAVAAAESEILTLVQSLAGPLRWRPLEPHPMP